MANSIEQNQVYMNRVIEMMDEEKRNLIIEAKHSILTEEGRTPFNGSYYIYDAIIFKNLKKYDEIINYLKENGVEL